MSAAASAPSDGSRIRGGSSSGCRTSPMPPRRRRSPCSPSQYAKAFPELRVNVVDPGHTATDLNGFRGTQTVEQGAEPIVNAALLTPDGPTGMSFDSAGISPR